MIKIFSGSYAETMNVKNLLENIPIDVFVLNQNMGTIEPWVVTSGGLNAVTLTINEEDFEKAATLIEAYKSGALGF